MVATLLEFVDILCVGLVAQKCPHQLYGDVYSKQTMRLLKITPGITPYLFPLFLF